MNGLNLLYENNDDFAPISSFGVIPAFGGLALLVTDGVPGLSIDLSRVLHGEQYTELLNPIPTGTFGTLAGRYNNREHLFHCSKSENYKMLIFIISYSIYL